MTPSSAAFLLVIGLAIAAVWAWMWAGLDARSRRLALAIFRDEATDVCEQLQRLSWVVLPLLSFTWCAAAFLVYREAVAGPSIGARGLVALSLSLILLLFLLGMAGVKLPEWIYPGWRAKRFYEVHPHYRDELEGINMSGGVQA